MATSSVRINGSATPVENLAIGSTVTLTNFDDTGATTWAWLLLSKPSGSAASIAAATASSTTFTADLEGSYLIQLTVNGTVKSTAVGRILATHTGTKVLARDEIEEGDAAGINGWAKPARDSALLLDKRLGLATRKTVKFTGANNTGPLLLKITGAATLANGDAVPTVDLASTSAGYGGLVFFDKTTGINTNDVVSVVVNGFTDLFANPDTLIAEDKVYESSTPGALTKTRSSDNAVLIGYCAAVSGGNVRLWIGIGQRAGIGDFTLSAFGSTPDAKGAILTGQALALQPADATHPGLVTTGAQTIGGAKTLASVLNSTVASGSDAIKIIDNARINLSTADTNAYLYRSAVDTIRTPGSFTVDAILSGSNLSGTNTGDFTLSAFGATPDAKGAILTGQALALQPADATHPGLITTGTQTIAGVKTFSADLTASSGIHIPVSQTLFMNVGGTAGIYTDGTGVMNPFCASRASFTTAVGVPIEVDAGFYRSSAASGSDALKTLDGARLNLSTSDSNAYFYRLATDLIGAAGSFFVTGTNCSISNATMDFQVRTPGNVAFRVRPASGLVDCWVNLTSSYFDSWDEGGNTLMEFASRGGTGRNYAATSGFFPSASFVPKFQPPSGSASFAAIQIKPTINGTSSGKAAALAIASLTNTLAGGSIKLIDAGTTTTDYITGFTSAFSVGTDGTTITAGGITANGQSHVRARCTNSTAFASTTPDVIVFDSETYDVLNEYNPSTGLFTAAVTGYYSIKASAVLAATALLANYSWQIWIENNSTIVQYGSTWLAQAAVTFGMESFVSATIKLTAGDIVRIRAVTVGAGQNLLGGSGPSVSLSIDRLP